MERRVDIRWSSYIRDDMPAALRKNPFYAVAQINNVFNNPKEAGTPRWVAFPRPHVVIPWALSRICQVALRGNCRRREQDLGAGPASLSTP
jgi:hypothetical protein